VSSAYGKVLSSLYCMSQCCAVLLYCMSQCCAVQLYCMSQCCAVLLYCMSQCCAVQLYCMSQCCAVPLNVMSQFCAVPLYCASQRCAVPLYHPSQRCAVPLSLCCKSVSRYFNFCKILSWEIREQDRFRQYLLPFSSECCMFTAIGLTFFLSFFVGVKFGALHQEKNTD